MGSSSFKPEFFYFELVDFLRKSIFTGFLLFVEQGSIDQLFADSFMALAFLLLQVVALPFKRRAHNWLKLVELMALLLTFQVCLGIKVKANLGQDELNWAYDFFLVAIVLLMLAIFVASTALAVWRS